MEGLPKKLQVKGHQLWPIGTKLEGKYFDGVWEIIEYAWSNKGNFFKLRGAIGSVTWCYRVKKVGGLEEIVITDHLADLAVKEHYQKRKT